MEPFIIYCITSYGILMVGCYVFTRFLYPQRTARIVLALFSPVVFIVVGSILAAAISIGINTVQIVVGVRWFQLLPKDHQFGITFTLAALACVWTLKELSDREKQKKQEGTIKDGSGSPPKVSNGPL